MNSAFPRISQPVNSDRRRTALVPKNDNESCSKMVHCVLNTSQPILIHQIAGRADNEEVTNGLIKNDLGRPHFSGFRDAVFHCTNSTRALKWFWRLDSSLPFFRSGIGP